MHVHQAGAYTVPVPFAAAPVQQNPPDEAFLACNLLSNVWKWNTIKSFPGVLVFWPFFYSLGMIGYMIALPFRAALVVYELLHLVYSFMTSVGRQGFWPKMKVRSIMLTVSLGEVASGVIGCICPPIAYKMDEFFEYSQIVRNDRCLPWWLGDTPHGGGAQVVPPVHPAPVHPAPVPPVPVHPVPVPVHPVHPAQMQAVGTRFIPYFKEAIERLHAVREMEEDVEICNATFHTTALGLCFAILDGQSIELLFPDIVAKSATNKKDKERDLNAYAETAQKAFEQFPRYQRTETIKENLVKAAVAHHQKTQSSLINELSMVHAMVQIAYSLDKKMEKIAIDEAYTSFLREGEWIES